MGYVDLWKYCTAEHIKEFLLSFQLLGASEMAKEEQLRCLYTVERHAEQHYKKAAIRKRSGGIRHILIPDPLLKKIQRNILHNILETIPVSKYATAYQKGAALLDNARGHAGKKQILMLDIKDFFGHITETMIYQNAFPRAYFPPAAAALLTGLCCYDGYLPQGAPTSAAISNLVMKHFDVSLGQWCENRGITYTRYCDDMAFSGEFDPKEVKNKVRAYLESMGFSLNSRKTRHLSEHQRQSVTGLVVNERPQTAAAYRRKLRQEIYYCVKYGAASHLETLHGAAPSKKDIEAYLQSLMGRVAFVLQIDPENAFFQEAKGKIKAWQKKIGS